MTAEERKSIQDIVATGLMDMVDKIATKHGIIMQYVMVIQLGTQYGQLSSYTDTDDITKALAVAYNSIDLPPDRIHVYNVNLDK